MTKENLYLGKEKEKIPKWWLQQCVIAKYHAMPYFSLFSQRRGDNIKRTPTLGTFTFQTFLKVMQNATPQDGGWNEDVCSKHY